MRHWFLKGAAIQQPDPHRERQDAHIRITAHRDPNEALATPPGAPPLVGSLYIRRSDMAQHGCTPGCQVCTARRLQKSPQGHNVSRTNLGVAQESLGDEAAQ